MTKASDTNQLGWPRWQQALLIALVLLFMSIRLTSQVDAVAQRAGLFGEFPLIEATVANDPNAPAGFRKVVRVEPNSSAARAGTRIGDYLRVDSFFRDGRQLSPRFNTEEHLNAGDWINFTRDRDGIRSDYQIILQPVPAGHAQEYRNRLRMVNVLAGIISSLVGCFVLWRGWGNITAMLLGGALAVVGGSGVGIPPWVSNPALENAMWWLIVVSSALAALLIPFAIRMLEQQGRALPRWHWRLATVWFIWCLVSLTALTSDFLGVTNFNFLTWASYGYLAQLKLVSLLVAIAYLVAGWRRAGAAERSRFTLIIFALAAYLFAAVLVVVEQAQTGAIFGATGSAALILFNAVMQGIVAPGLLAYAVLRHKLFDLGFAVNRTLVFGTVSAVLLVGIGLTEYAVKALLPKVWTQGSVFISAGLAVGVFLIFHRIHHSVEHFIERLFFHKWQVNEAALKRFVAAAAHVEKPEALAGNFVAELVRFTGGASASLYTRTAEGHYASAAGEEIDADDPALAAMRAEQGAVVPAELGSPLDAALALPMMHQAALAGFVLLGPKPGGEDYRPDEIDNLAWATQQIGLDLQAIRVRDLEQTVTRLEVQNGSLESHNRNLTDILAGRQTTSASGRTK